jgi:hypothetical protein
MIQDRRADAADALFVLHVVDGVALRADPLQVGDQFGSVGDRLGCTGCQLDAIEERVKLPDIDLYPVIAFVNVDRDRS